MLFVDRWISFANILLRTFDLLNMQLGLRHPMLKALLRLLGALRLKCECLALSHGPPASLSPGLRLSDTGRPGERPSTA